jgi:hypothetical protein
MLQGQRDLATVSDMILCELAPLVSAQHGVFYVMTNASNNQPSMLEFQAGYGLEERKHLSTSVKMGDGLVGQCAKEGKRILLTDVPSDYVRINSGLGSSSPLNIIVLPVLFELVLALQSHSPDGPRPTHREHRSCPQYGRSEQPHRRTPQAVPVAGGDPSIATGRAPGVERGSRTPDQAARGAEHRGGAQETGSGGRQASG